MTAGILSWMRIVVVCGLVSLRAYADVTNGLVLHYGFDADDGSNVVDVTANHLDGTGYGVVHSDDGMGQALDFDSGDYVASPTNALLNLGATDDKTFALWWKADTLAPQNIGLVSKRAEADANRGLAFSIEYGVQYYLALQIDHWVKYRPASMATGQWNHVVLTKSGSTWKVYHNGQVLPVYSSMGWPFSADVQVDVPVWLGHDFFPGMDFDGRMDDFRVYGRALASNEVAVLYTSGHDSLGAVSYTVAGNPGALGAPSPYGYGTCLIDAPMTVTNSVISPVAGADGVRYVCAGWTGSGSVPASGTDIVVVVSVSSNSTLTWNWQTEYYLDTGAGSHGVVDVGDGWYSNGAPVTITALADDGYHFVSWYGDVPAGSATSHAITVTMSQSRTLAAAFAVDAPAGLDSGLVLHYSFGTNVTPVVDDSGNGRVGAVYGATWRSDGMSSGAYRLDGTNDYINAGRDGGLNLTNNLTISVWFKKAPKTFGAPHQLQAIVGRDDGVDQTGRTFLLYRGDTPWENVAFCYGVASGGVDGRHEIIATNLPLADEQWHHVLIAHEVGVGNRLYVDGLCVAQDSEGSPLPSTPNTDVLIGDTVAWEPWFFYGALDEVRIYNRALLPDEVQAVYNLGACAKLAVIGLPDRYGNPQTHGYGTNSLLLGSVLTNSVASPVSGGAGIRYSCTGWTGTGDVPASGTGTSVVFTVTTNSTLTWNWRTEYYLHTGAGSHGSVDVVDGWYTNGAVVTIQAAASNGYHFAAWAGDVPGGSATNNPLTVSMGQARTLVAGFAANSNSLSDGLVLYYSFSTNGSPVADESGNGHAGTVSGASWTAGGIVGGAYGFDGTNDVITASDFSTDYDDVTVSAWIRPSSFDTNGACWNEVVDAWIGGGATPFRLGVENSETLGSVVWMYENGSGYVFTRSGNLPLNVWSHVVGVRQNTGAGYKLTVYVNGLYGNSTTSSVVPSKSGSQQLAIGARTLNPDNDERFDGLIDEVLIFNRALTEDDVVSLYADGAGPVARLVVAGNPDKRGSPSPLGYGTNLVALASVVTNSVASPVAGGAGLRYVCTGWTGTGAVTNGVGTSAVFTLTTNSTLTWNWRTEHYLDTGAGSNGSVDVGDGWYTNGAVVTIQAVASNGYHFASWSGDVPGGSATNNPLSVSMDQARILVAEFAANSNQLSDGLVLYYSFDSSASVVSDDSGNGHAGTVSGASWTAGGIVGGAYGFDGTNDVITASAFSTDYDDVTVSAWIRPSSFDTNGACWNEVVDAWIGGGATPFRLGVENSETLGSVVWMYENGSGYVFTRSGNLPLNVWSHVVGVRQNTGAGYKLTVYVNGLYGNSTTSSVVPSKSGSQQLAVGARTLNPGNDERFDGLIDEVLVFNRALTEDDVVSLYSDGAGPVARLVVAGNPDKRGSPSPLGYGTNLVALASVVTNSVASPVAGGAGLRYVCAGWTGTGDVTNGIGTSAVFAVSTNSTLTWNWQTEFYLDTGAGSHGCVDVGDGWYTNGAVVTVQAVASNGYHFASWSGDAPGGSATNNPLSVTMGQARTLVAGFAANSNQLSNGLVLYYSFDSSAAVVPDDSGNGHTGAVYGATWIADGQMGGVYNFDGTNDYIRVPGYKGVSGNAPRTVSLWFRTTQTGSNIPILFYGNWGVAAGDGVWLGINYVSAGANLQLDGGQIIRQSVATNDGAWHQAVFTYNGTAVCFYVDSILIGESTNMVLNSGTTYDVFLGRYGPGTYYFRGAMDEVRVYDRAIDVDEVVALYELTSGATARLVISGNPAGYGSPMPQGYGTNLVLVGVSVTNSVSSPVSGGAGVRHVCEGWNGIGDVTSGVGTSVVYTVTTNSTLTWNWRTECYLDTEAGSYGVVDVGDGWYANEANVAVTASGLDGHQFAFWSGNVPSDVATNNPLTVTMDQARTIVANFTTGGEEGGVTNGLVLHYTFDSDSETNVWDSSGSGNHGCLVGAATRAAGLFGSAVRIQSPGSYVLSSSRRLNMNGWTGFTASVWVMLKGYTTYGHVMGRGEVTGGTPGAFEMTVGGAYGGVYGQGVVDVWTSATSSVEAASSRTFANNVVPYPSLNRWYHLVETCDGFNVRYYIDGVLESNVQVDAVGRLLWDSPDSKLVIGTVSRTPLVNWSDMHMNGLIDEVQIFNRALLGSEVSQLHLSGQSSRVKLMVAGSPAQSGNPEPYGYGTNFVALGGAVVEVVSSPVASGTGVRSICTGWTGTGDVTNGTGTSVSFVATTNSTLTWNWRTEYYLDAVAGAHGSVNADVGWYTNDASVSISAVASNGYRFAFWSGDVPSGAVTNNPLTLTMDQARSLTATFVLDSQAGDGLLLYYSFDSSVTPVSDDSGNGHTGIVNGATWVPDGRIGGAYVCSGPSNTVEVPAWQPTAGNQSFGASFWIRSTHSYAGAEAGLLTWGYPRPSGLGTWCGIKSAGTDTTNTTIYFDNGGSGTITARTTVNDGIWHHVAVAYDAAQCRVAIYIDGILEASRSIVMNVRMGGNLAVGWETYDRNIPAFDGAIDEIRLYNRALVPDEIVALYAAGVGSVAKFVVDGDPLKCGNPMPNGYGTNLVRVSTLVTNKVAGTVAGGAGVRYVCTGWTGTGDVTNGVGTNVSFSVTTNSSVTWKWRTEYYLDTAAGANGAVDVGDGWFTNGAGVVITATASNGYRFVGWTGNVPSSLITNNPLSITMDQARTVGARFAWGSQANLSDGLVLCYRFDTNSTPVPDDSGNGHTGTVSGTTWVSDGRSGGAYSFNGQSNKIETLGWQPTVEDQSFGATFWVRSIHDYEGAEAGLLTWGYPRPSGLGTWCGINVGGYNTTNSTIYFDNGGSGTISAHTTVNDGMWHHVAVVYDAEQCKVGIYVDGVLEASRSISMNVRIGGNLAVGWETYDRNMPAFDGAIDEVRIYDRALAADEVTALYTLVSGPTAQLVVNGVPGRYGSPVPYGYGTNESIALGQAVTNGVSSPVAGGTGVLHHCVGWIGTGDVTNGTGTEAVFTVTTNSTLTWQWRTEYYLDTAAGAHGNVNVGDGWYTNGSVVTLTAIPDSACTFSSWTGDVPGGLETANPLTVTMDRARTITAQFTLPTYTLAGQVFYSGAQSGTIYIEAFTNASYLNRVAWTQIGAPGRYELPALPAGRNYWVRGYLDGNGNGSLSSVEPVAGYAGNPLLALSANHSDIDIRLQRLTAPQGVTAVGGVGSIILGWNPNPEPGIAGYNVYRFNMEWGIFERLNGAPIDGLSFVDRGVEADEPYFYYVSAVIMSDYQSSYMESPASAIVGAVAGEISLWMPDYCGPTGAVVRLRINASDASGILASDMAITVSYDPAFLTPLSKVDAGRATVEKTALTQGMTVTNNGLTATGQLQIVATDLGLTNHATLKILGCSYMKSSRKAIPIHAKYRKNGGEWAWIRDGVDVNDGEAYQVDLGTVLSDGTNCVLNVKETDRDHERQSDSAGGYVMVLRDGDSILNVPGVTRMEDVQYRLRSYVDESMTLRMGPKDVLYLFELGDDTNGVSAGYQDVVAMVEFDRGSALTGGGRLFDVLFVVASNKVNGTQASHAFVSASIKDQMGNSIGADISDTAVFTVRTNYFLGDINGDGTVDVSGDFTLAMKLAVGQRDATVLELMAGDIDGDGVIGKEDATLIKRIAMGLPLNEGGTVPLALPDPRLVASMAAFSSNPDLVAMSEEPSGSGYALSIGQFNVEPGSVVQVPVLIDNAAGVASIDVRINYDSNVLLLLGVAKGTLTSEFGLEYREGAGYLDVAMAGASGLSAGSGTLFTMNFYAPESVELGMMTDLTISRYGLGDEHGGNLGWNSGIAVSHGMAGVALTNALSILGAGQDGGYGFEWATQWGKTYRIETSTNLMSGFVPLQGGFTGNGTIKAYVDTQGTNAPARFYRVVEE